MATPGRLLVMGAGSVGCYLGGALQAAGAAVDFVGRPNWIAELRRHGLRLSDLDGGQRQLPASDLRLHEQIPPGCAPALVLLCVKTGATEAAAAELAAALPDGTLVISMQNGLGNAQAAARVAPGLVCLPGMVPFNLARLAPGQVHRGTTGQLAAQDHPTLRDWLPVFRRAGLPLALWPDLRPLQWGKLLLNLNNPVNALSGLPLRAQLLDPVHRSAFADLMEEALGLMRQAGIRPARLTPLPWSWVPRLLRLPTPLFRLAAARMLRIDAQARSSMADDLAAGRSTEIDALCGEVMRLAIWLDAQAPRNAAMLARIRAATG
jgi:2-dehydropantoate 2-reductase